MRLESIKFGFDERAWGEMKPLGSMNGMVEIGFDDSTAIRDSCTRGTLEATMVRLINTKLEQIEAVQTNLTGRNTKR